MIRFDNKIEAVINHYHQRIEEETALSETLTMEERMHRIDEFLLPVGAETGTFLNTLAKAAGARTILEIGTSYGYSTIWLAEAARANGGRVITLEISEEKSAYAKERITEAGLFLYVDFRVGDALQLIEQATETFDFVLVDLWKELYTPCLERFLSKLEKGAWVVADNMIYPPHDAPMVTAYRNHVKETGAFDTLLLPIGSGIEVSQHK
jgi:predicted O-methyltransferase YrrM